MNDRELSDALLTYDTSPAPATLDPKQLTRNIIDRDGRRIRWLVALTSFLWVAATGGIVGLAFMYFFIVEPRLIAYGEGRVQLENDWKDWAWAGDLAARSLLLCLMTLLLAAISTVALVLFSRRATLRQINISLTEIAHHLQTKT